MHFVKLIRFSSEFLDACILQCTVCDLRDSQLPLCRFQEEGYGILLNCTIILMVCRESFVKLNSVLIVIRLAIYCHILRNSLKWLEMED